MSIIRPVGDRIIVKPDDGSGRTPGGVIIPPTASAHKRPHAGTVVAVGPGDLDRRGVRTPPAVAVGDYILFVKWAGKEVEADGVDYFFLRAEHVLSVVEGYTPPDPLDRG